MLLNAKQYIIQFECIAVPLINQSDCYEITKQTLTEIFGEDRVVQRAIEVLDQRHFPM